MDAGFAQGLNIIHQDVADDFLGGHNLFLMFHAINEEFFRPPHHGEDAQGAVHEAHDCDLGAGLVHQDFMHLDVLRHSFTLGGIKALYFGDEIVRTSNQGIIIVGVRSVFGGVDHFLTEVVGFHGQIYQCDKGIISEHFL